VKPAISGKYPVGLVNFLFCQGNLLFKNN